MEDRTGDALVLLRALLGIEVRSLWLVRPDDGDTWESGEWDKDDWLPRMVLLDWGEPEAESPSSSSSKGSSKRGEVIPTPASTASGSRLI